MMTRATRLIFASALTVFLFAQPFAALAFDDCSGMSCCKDKCCRKMHHAPTEPGFTSHNYCAQCHVSVRNTQPVPANIVSLPVATEPAPSQSEVVFRSACPTAAQPNPVLFERPPPA